MQVSELKTVMDQIYLLCDGLEEKVNLQEQLGLHDEATFKSILKMNVLFYLAYLAASDGVISWKESRFIGELMDLNMTPAKLHEIIEDNDIYSTDFEDQAPMILQIFVAMDNAVYENGLDIDIEFGEAVFEIYRFMTIGLNESNGRTAETMDESVKRDADAYLGMMRKYIDEKTERHHMDIILDCEKKHNNSRKDSEDKGVQAPKKRGNTSGSVRAPRKRA